MLALCYAAAPIYAKPNKLLRNISQNAPRRTGAEGGAAVSGAPLLPAAYTLTPQLTQALETAVQDAQKADAVKLLFATHLVNWGKQLVLADEQLMRPYRAARPETAARPLEGNPNLHITISPLDYYALWATSLRPHAGSRYAALFPYAAPDLAGLSKEQLAQYAYLRHTIIQNLKIFHRIRTSPHAIPFQYVHNARQLEKSVMQMARFMGRRPDVFAAALHALRQDVFPQSSFARDLQRAADGK